MSKKLTRFTFILVFVFGLTFLGFSQGSQTGSINGTVKDDEGNPLPGATVTISGPEMMGEKTYMTSQTGKFRFPSLPPGKNYQIKVEMSGFKTMSRKGLIVHLGKTTTVNLTLEVATVKEEMTVTAESPTVDVESSKVSVNYSSDFIATIPMNRDLYDIQNSVPGAISEERAYRRTSSILGGTVRSTLYSLDGAIMNDPATFYSITNINIDIYEEMEVTMGSLPASVGQTDSAYINIVTKSGGNKFSGGVTAYYTGDILGEYLVSEEETEAMGINPPERYSDYKDGSVNIGGPIIKDRLWFFLNGRRMLYKKVLSIAPEKRTAALGIDTPHYDWEHYEWMGFGKLTFQLTKNIQYMGMLHYNQIYEPVYSNDFDTNQSYPATRVWDHEDGIATTHQVNWVMNQNTFLNIKGAYYYRHFPILARPGTENAYTYYDRRESVYFGRIWYDDDYIRKRMIGSSQITHFKDDFLGASHEFKLGIEGGQTEYHRDWYRGDNPYYSYWRDYAGGNPYYYSTSGRRGRLRLRFCPSGPDNWDVVDNVRRISGFVQDNITSGRLSINAGVRVDYTYQFEPEQTRPEMTQFYKYGPDQLNPNITDPNALLRALIKAEHDEGYLTPFDPLTTPWKKIVEFFTLSPRLGVIYDLFGDGKTAVKASFSRYYEPVWSAKYNAAQIFGAGTYQWYWYDDNGNKLMDLPGQGDHYRIRYRYNQNPDYKYYFTWESVKKFIETHDESVLEPGLAPPYMDEVTVGIEHELFQDFNLGLKFIRKWNRNIVEDVDKFNGYDETLTDEKGNIWVPYTATDPGWDGEFGTDDDSEITVYGLRDDRPEPEYIGTNPPEAKRDYQAVMLTFNKRMSNNWQLNGSVLYSSFKGNCSATYGPTEGESGMFDSPNDMINAYGPDWFDRPLQVKIMGTYIFPYDFIVSAYFKHLSGKPWTRHIRVYFPDNYDVQSSYEYVNAETRGSRRRPSYTTLDLRVEKSFTLGDGGKLNFYVDIFNLGGYRKISIQNDPEGYLKYYRDPPYYEPRYTYGRILEAEGVRSIRIGVRWSF